MLDTVQNYFLISMWVALSIAFLVLLNHLWAPSKRRVHNDVIGWQISIVGTIYAVMIGFMLYAVWANFQTAETNADNEANALVNFFRSVEGLPPAQRSGLEIAAANYVNAVITQEFPTMSRGGGPHAGHDAVVRMWALVTEPSQLNPSQQIGLEQTMHELSDLTEHRRIRILESTTKMPTILWMVLVVGGMITIGACCLIGTENVTLHYGLILCLSLLISLALIAIGDIDRPFQGSVHVGSQAFVRARDSMLSPSTNPQ